MICNIYKYIVNIFNSFANAYIKDIMQYLSVAYPLLFNN